MSSYGHLLLGQIGCCLLYMKLWMLCAYLGDNLADVLVPNTDVSG